VAQARHHFHFLDEARLELRAPGKGAPQDLHRRAQVSTFAHFEDDPHAALADNAAHHPIGARHPLAYAKSGRRVRPHVPSPEDRLVRQAPPRAFSFGPPNRLSHKKSSAGTGDIA
jgi:hypothetical protein